MVCVEGSKGGGGGQLYLVGGKGGVSCQSHWRGTGSSAYWHRNAPPVTPELRWDRVERLAAFRRSSSPVQGE